MSDATKISISINNSAKNKAPFQTTYKKIVEMINDLNLDEETTKNLIEMAARYPTNALSTFGKNINFMIQRARAKRTNNAKEKESNS